MYKNERRQRLIQQTDNAIRRIIKIIKDEQIKSAQNSSVSPNNMSPVQQASKKEAIAIDGDKANDECPKCQKKVFTGDCAVQQFQLLAPL